jgi:hypothetical protein
MEWAGRMRPAWSRRIRQQQDATLRDDEGRRREVVINASCQHETSTDERDREKLLPAGLSQLQIYGDSLTHISE